MARDGKQEKSFQFMASVEKEDKKFMWLSCKARKVLKKS